MIRWLYRYIFRGIGMVLLIGMITALYLAFVLVHEHGKAPQAPRGRSTVSGKRPPRSLGDA